MRAYLFVTGFAALMLAQVASAQVIYQSAPDLQANPTDGSYCSGCDGGTQTVGSLFTLTSAATIRSIQFVVGDYEWPSSATIGIYGVGAAPDFSWDGSIGTQYYWQTFGTYASEVDTAYYSHVLGVNTGDITLAAGTYAITFNNPITLAPASFSFYEGGRGITTYWDDFNSLTGEGYFLNGADIGFLLSGDVIGAAAPPPPAVPEPASWAMMVAGFGLAGLALRRRRTHIRFA